MSITPNFNNNYIDNPYYEMKTVEGTSGYYNPNTIDYPNQLQPGFFDNLPDFPINTMTLDVFDGYKMYDHEDGQILFNLHGFAEVDVDGSGCAPQPIDDLDINLADMYPQIIVEEAMMVNVNLRNLLENPFDTDYLSEPDLEESVYTDTDNLRTFGICYSTSQDGSEAIISPDDEGDYTIDNIPLDFTEISTGLVTEYTDVNTFWIQLEDNSLLNIEEIRLIRNGIGGGQPVQVVANLYVSGGDDTDNLYWFHVDSEFSDWFSDINFYSYALMATDMDLFLEFDFTMNSCPPIGDENTYTINYSMGVGCGTIGFDSNGQPLGGFDLTKCQICNTSNPAFPDCFNLNDDNDNMYYSLCDEEWDGDWDEKWDVDHGGFRGSVQARLTNEVLNATWEDISDCEPSFTFDLSIPIPLPDDVELIMDAQDIEFVITYPIEWGVDPTVSTIECVLIASPLPSDPGYITQSYSCDPSLSISQGEFVSVTVLFPTGVSYSTGIITTSVLANNVCGNPLTISSNTNSYDFTGNTFEYNITNETCSGNADGNADGTIEVLINGVSPANIIWLVCPAGFSCPDEGMNPISNAVEGNYTIIVIDGNGCSTGHEIYVGVDSESCCNEEFSLDITELPYCDPCGASLSVITPVGVSPTYLWSGPSGFSATTQTISNLCAGTYSVTISYNTDCQETLEYTIECNCDQNAEPIMESNEDCIAEFSVNVGELCAIPEYQWILSSNGNIITDVTLPSPTFNTGILDPGTYTICVTIKCNGGGSDCLDLDQCLTFELNCLPPESFCRIIEDYDSNPSIDRIGSGNGITALSTGGYAIAGGINYSPGYLRHYVTKFETNEIQQYGTFFGYMNDNNIDYEKTNDILEHGDFVYTIGEVNTQNSIDVVVSKIDKQSGIVIWKNHYDFSNGNNNTLEHGYAGEMIYHNGRNKLIVVGKSDKNKAPNTCMFAMRINASDGDFEDVNFYYNNPHANDEIAYDLVALKNTKSLVIVGESNGYGAAIKIDYNLVLNATDKFIINNKLSSLRTVDFSGPRVYALGYCKNYANNPMDILIINFDFNLNSNISSINGRWIDHSPSNQPKSEMINDFISKNNLIYACGVSRNVNENENNGLMMKLNTNYSSIKLFETQYPSIEDGLNAIAYIEGDKLVTTGCLEFESNNTDLFLVKTGLDFLSCCTKEYKNSSGNPYLMKTINMQSTTDNWISKTEIPEQIDRRRVNDLCLKYNGANVNLDHFENFKATLNVVPNPNEGKFNVSLISNSNLKIAKVRILDISGKLLNEIVLNSENLPDNVNLDLSTYPVGIYLIELFSDNNLKFIGRVSILK